MKKNKPILLFLLVFVLLATPALVHGIDLPGLESLGGKSPLQNLLSQSVVVIDGYTLKTDELRRFYALRNDKPVWDTSPGVSRDSLKSFLSSVTAFEKYHGLVEDNYPAQQLAKLIESKDEADSVKIELLITAWLLRLAHDMHGDNVKLEHLYVGWTFKRLPADITGAMAKAVEDSRVYDFISDLAPVQPDYLYLARALKKYREMAEKSPWPTVDEGPTIRPGESDPRVAQIRARLAAENYLESSEAAGNAKLYDETLKSAVENYQGRNGLLPDGDIGAKTVQAMNVPLKNRIEQIMANMERWRHMPEAQASRRIEVNIASAMAEVLEDGKILYKGPVIVGRRDRKTPFIQSAVRSVIFNPAWYVPAKIARHDILPKLRKDPYYLEKMGFVINGSADDPHGAAIDWDSVEASEFNFRLRQSPGDLNSLGRLKFDFDNNFAVYMHGTPHNELFEKAERNLSSGCVRLKDPDQFAVVVLGKNECDWTLEKVQAEVEKGRTHWLKISEPIPVAFNYWTAFPPGDEGPLNFRRDVYNYDAFLIEVLNKGGVEDSPYTKKNSVNPLIAKDNSQESTVF